MWGEGSERSQAASYIHYLQSHIDLRSLDCIWINAANYHPQLLITDATSSSGRRFEGTADVAVCSRSAVEGNVPSAGLPLIITLKKARISSPDVTRAMASLLLAKLHSAKWQPMMVRFQSNIAIMHPLSWSCHIPRNKCIMQDDSGSRCTPDALNQHSVLAIS